MFKVVSLSEAREKKAEKTEKPEPEMNFEEVMEHNKRNKKRLERERQQANRSVLRSYRIKN